MIEITDKQDGQKKLRRSYEDYIPLETQETQETTEPATQPTETQPTEAGEEIAIPDTSEPAEAEN